LVAPLGVLQRPGFVGDTALPFGAAHRPPQQSLALKHISLFCRHQEDAWLQVPFVQSPEQHALFPVQALPDVRQVGVPLLVPPSGRVPIAAHFPLTHVSVQHVFPPVGHVWPIETH
jgi:hypothetical protein